MKYYTGRDKIQWVAIALAFTGGWIGLQHYYLGRGDVGLIKTIFSANVVFIYFMGHCNPWIVPGYCSIILIYWLVSFWHIFKMTNHRFKSIYS